MRLRFIPLILLGSFFFFTSTPTTYFIGRDPSWYPSQLGDFTPYINAYTNNLTQMIGKESGIKLEILDSDSLSLLSDLKKGKYEGAYSNLAPLIEAKDQYDFSPPFLSLGDVLVVPVLSDITSVKDLPGKRVGVYLFDRSLSVAESIYDVIITTYDNIPKALDALATEEIDALLIPILPAQALISAFYNDSLHIITPPLTNEAFRLVTTKGKNEELQKKFTSGLEALEKNGELKKLQESLEHQMRSSCAPVSPKR